MKDDRKGAEERYIKTPAGAESYRRWKEASADPSKETTPFMMGDWMTSPRRGTTVGSGEDNRFKNLMKSVAAKKAGKKVGKPAPDELSSDPSRMSNPFIDINNPAKNVKKYGK